MYISTLGKVWLINLGILYVTELPQNETQVLMKVGGTPYGE